MERVAVLQEQVGKMWTVIIHQNFTLGCILFEIMIKIIECEDREISRRFPFQILGNLGK